MTGVFVRSTATWRPPQSMSTDAAIAAGLYSAEDQESSGQIEVPIADDGQRAPDMAVDAARICLERSGESAASIDLLMYVVAMNSGVDLWNSAAYLQRRLECPGALGIETRGASNGGLLTLELAVGYLRGTVEARHALICSADLWQQPYFDRWHADPGILFGDAGTALLVSTESGFARIAGLATVTDPTLEALHRGHEEFGPYRYENGPVDLHRRAREFAETTPLSEIIDRSITGLTSAFTRALDQAGTVVADIDHVVLPFFSRRLNMHQFVYPLGLTESTIHWETGARTGHLGGGDQFAGLDGLMHTGDVAAGERIVLIGVGAGFTWTCAVLEVVDTPDYASPRQ